MWLISFAPCTMRMRAAVFINAVAIREAVSLKYGPLLPQQCVQKLQTANYLFHAALNCNLAFVCFCTLLSWMLCRLHALGIIQYCRHAMVFSGLACEAISAGILRWKIRPKLHKFPSFTIREICGIPC